MGILFKPLWSSSNWSWMTLGFRLQNILLGKVKRDNFEDIYPLSGRLGISLDPIDTNYHHLTLAMDAEKQEWRTVKYYAGVEYSLFQQFALRLGYDQSEFTAGVGYHWHNWCVDYALLKHEELGMTHRASLGFSFGKERESWGNR